MAGPGSSTQSTVTLAVLYARLRHPQYMAFFAIMLGFLLQWPTILTLLMFPLLVWMFTRLRLAEERDALREFGADLGALRRRDATVVPALERPEHRRSPRRLVRPRDDTLLGLYRFI
jgi:protein-S-isoprenylcysteine O-methyltransferase Ste14